MELQDYIIDKEIRELIYSFDKLVSEHVIYIVNESLGGILRKYYRTMPGNLDPDICPFMVYAHYQDIDRYKEICGDPDLFNISFLAVSVDMERKDVGISEWTNKSDRSKISFATGSYTSIFSQESGHAYGCILTKRVLENCLSTLLTMKSEFYESFIRKFYGKIH